MSDPCWTPPDAQEVVGLWWDEYARRRKLTWEMGRAWHRDQQGKPYITLMWYGLHREGEPGQVHFGPLAELLEYFESSLDEYLGTHAHIVWRIFPTLRDLPRKGHELRARLCSYPVKPITVPVGK